MQISTSALKRKKKCWGGGAGQMGNLKQLKSKQISKVKGTPEKVQLPFDDSLFGGISCPDTPHGHG